MNKLLTILVCTVLLISVKGAFCGTSDVVRLLENREFWSIYEWDQYTDSPFYGSVTWKPSGMLLHGDVKVGETYLTEVVINDLPVRELRMELDVATGNINSFALGSYNFTDDAYRMFFEWCTARFGRADREEERSENQEAVIKTTVESIWKINDTRITVTTVKHVRNDPNAVASINTKLTFAKNNRPHGAVTSGRTSSTPRGPDKPLPAIVSSAQRPARGGGEFLASQPTSARAGQARPVLSSYRAPVATDSGSAETGGGQRYQPPPYIWESANGAIMAANNISDVPEEIRVQFELKLGK